jgi:hypothetical protein
MVYNMIQDALLVEKTRGRSAGTDNRSDFSLSPTAMAATDAPAAVNRLVQAPSSSAGQVRFNIFDLGMAPPLPQDVFSRAVRAVADGIGSVVGRVFDIPEGTEASRQAPMLVHALRQRGIEVSPEGDIALPNTPEGGAMFADLVVLSHAPGDRSLYPGLYGLQHFREPAILENAGFNDAFIAGFLEKADGHSRSAGYTSLLAFWGIAGGVTGGRNNSPYRELTRVVNQREAAQRSRLPPASEEPPITLSRQPDGSYARNSHSTGDSPRPGPSARGGSMVPPDGGVPPSRGSGGGTGVLATGAFTTGANQQAVNGSGPGGLSASPATSSATATLSRQPPGEVYGPSDAAGIARWRGQVEQNEAARIRALETASRAHPVPTLEGVDVEVNTYNWDQVGEELRGFNARSHPLDTMVRVPVDRNHAGLGAHRQVGILRGAPFALSDQVAAMQRSGQIPQDFDLAGAASQVGVDWNAAIQAEADARANRVAANNPIELAGNRTFVRPDRAAALEGAVRFNGASSGADVVAVPVAINREIASGSISATGISHEIWVGSPDQFRNFYDTMNQRGQLGGNPDFAGLLSDAGIGGSFAGRVAAAQDLRAAQAEVAHPTTLFGSTVGVQPTAGAAQNVVVPFNRNPSPPEHFQLYVPLTREVSGPGLSPGARGTAHTIYQGPAENLRGFYDEMERQGRIPQGVSFEALLQQSGISSTYSERIAQRNAAGAAEEGAFLDARQTPQALDTPAEVDENIRRSLSPDELDQWERFLEEHPDVADLVIAAGRDASPESQAEAARALLKGAYGHDVVAWLRAGGFGSGRVPPGGNPRGIAAGGADEPGGTDGAGESHRDMEEYARLRASLPDVIAEVREAAANARPVATLRPGQNVAKLEYDLEGLTGHLYASSGNREIQDFVPPVAPGEEVIPPLYSNRGSDTEFKLLNWLARNLNEHLNGAETSGRIVLYSQYTVCEPCAHVIREFKRMFPQIDVIVIAGERQRPEGLSDHLPGTRTVPAPSGPEAQTERVSPFISPRSLFNPDPQAMAQAMEEWSARAAEGIAAGEPLGNVLDDIAARAHELGSRLYPGTPIAGGYGVARDSGARTTDLTHRLFADALEPTLDFITRDWANVVDRTTGAAPSFPASQLRERLAARDPEALSLSHLSRMETADGETITARIDIEPNEAADSAGYRVTTAYPSDPARIETIREALSERWEQMAGISPGDPRAVEAAADFYYDYIRLYWHMHGNDEIGTSLISGYLEEKGFPVTGLNPEASPSAGAFQNDRESFVRRFADGEYLAFSTPDAPAATPSDPRAELSRVLAEMPGGDAILEALASAPADALRDPDLIRQVLRALNETGEFVFRVDTRTYEEIEADGGFRLRNASDPAGGFIYAATDLYAGGGHTHPGGTLYIIRRPPEEERLGPEVFDFREESDQWYREFMESGQPRDPLENPLFDTDQLTPGQQRGLREHVDNDQIRFTRDIPLDEIAATILLGRDGRTPVEATPRATDRP